MFWISRTLEKNRLRFGTFKNSHIDTFTLKSMLLDGSRPVSRAFSLGGKMNKRITILSLALCISVAACNRSDVSQIQDGANQPEELQKVQPRVVYGNDDRLDLYQVDEEIWRTKASATVALMRSNKLTKNADGNYKISTSHYGQSMGLCTSEPFYDQVTAAFCSGSLIAPDVIMTAGHCVRTQSSCDSTKFVFNFGYKEANGDVSMAQADDVYSCKELIKSEVSSSTRTDYALIRLDRKVVGHNPIPVRQQGAVVEGDSLVVIGHPSGLPTKVAGGANVRDTSLAAYFIANLDTYGGNSGSAVFNAQTGVVEGILVRGERDFSWQNGCSVSNVCADDGCRGEDVTRVSEVLPYIDASELVPVDDEQNDDEQEEEERLLYAVSGELNLQIPDRNLEGIRHALPGVEVNANTRIHIDIQHTWIGDLSVMVQAPNGEVRVLHDRQGGSQDNLVGTYVWNELNTISRGAADGQWSIQVKDMAYADLGQLLKWAVESEPIVQP